MLSYEGRLIDCLAEASKDKRFNKEEREVLEKLSLYLYNEEKEDRIITERFGTGRIYGVVGSKIRFLIHDSSRGYNIGVID